ncbi:MAG: T9SS type A sorting domain-containing protein, partial [Draconibacterium sp.]
PLSMKTNCFNFPLHKCSSFCFAKTNLQNLDAYALLQTYSLWKEESDGVVQVLLANGSELCSGSLLNNTLQDYRPLILTAFHCIDIGPGLAYRNGILDNNEIQDSEDWLVRFGFKHTTCGGSTIGSVYTFDDTHFRAAWDSTDFALVELQDDILRDIYSVGQKVWLGWDKSGTTPSKVTCIHHPAGDVMKYTFDNESPAISNYGGTNNSHWFVDDWDIGNTEGGSSGSPLFDQNKKVIGQDHAGDGKPACDKDKGTYFGRLSRSWTGGGTDSTRLSNWLDPIGLGVATLNSVRPEPKYSESFNVLCSSKILSVIDLPPGYTFHHWNSSNVTLSGNTANPVQISPLNQGNAWIEAIVNTGWGLYTMPRMNFWTGPPNPDDFVVMVEITEGDAIIPNFNGEWELCEGEYYSFYLWPLPSVLPEKWGITDAIFYFGCGINIIDQGLGWANVYVNDISSGCAGIVEVYAECDDNYEFKWMDFTEGYCGYSMMFTPNPTSGETTLSIETNSTEKAFAETTEWELEVYNSMQSLKLKKQKLKGSSVTINTQSWKEGVYMVRVKYKGEILTGKLVVQK